MIAYIFAAFTLSFIVTVFSVPQILYLSHRKRLMDYPDDVRKLHITPTPNLGGISIFFGFILSTLIVIGFITSDNFPLMLAGAFLLFIVGMKDDLVGVGASKKLAAQIVAAGLLVFGSGVHIESFGGLFGIYTLPLLPAQLFTAFSVIIILNAVNLIDGVDGLASSIGVIASSTLGVILFMNGMIAESVLAFALTGALVGFLVYNFEPARIFMGDTGSMMIGYVLSFLAFKTMQSNVAEAAISMPAISIFVFAVLCIPMFDTLRIIIIRLKNRQNPLNPDANHVHHELLRAGFGHRGVVTILISANLVIIATAWALQNVDAHLQLLAFGLLTLGIIPGAKLFHSVLEPRNKSVGMHISSAGELTRVDRDDIAPQDVQSKVPKEKVEYLL